MKRYFLLFGSFFFLLPVCHGQDLQPGGWSVALSAGGIYSVSASMHGDISHYEASLAGGKTALQYPFGANRAYGIGAGAEGEYRLRRSPLGLYAGGSGLRFSSGNGFRSAQGGRFTMTIISADAGITYTFGQIYQTWNFYGKLGMVSSIISGSNRSGPNRFSDSLRFNSIDSRTGVEIEIGERYHFERLPLGIEASINYTNVNVFGKSYSDPATSGGLFSRSSINDGKNPDDPNDTSRIIDYLTLRIGARLYF